MTELSTAPVATSQDTLLRILHEFLAELGDSPAPVSLGVDLERQLGLGSLERAELLARVEQAFKIRLPDSALTDAHTPGALLRLVERAHSGPVRLVERDGAVVEQPLPATAWSLPETAQTLVDVARFRAQHDGELRHLRVLDESGRETALRFSDLWQRALGVAAGLGSLRLQAEDRVALVLPTSADFFIAFLGVLCAGCVPVPIYPPVRRAGLGSYLERQARLLANAGARAVLTDGELRQVGLLLRERVPTVRAVESVEALAATPGTAGARVAPEALGVIQYTSGSTGDPKGVALSHRAILANIRAIGEALAVTHRDVAVNWLPFYHDMGLIGSWLTSLYYGIPVVAMSPLQFLNRPESWLWAFHRFRGTASPAPNFALDLCCRKISDEAIEGLDLSSWRAALVGAEPVRPETLERFIARFAPYGFRREALLPVYGMAETSVALTMTPLGRGPRYDRVDRESLAAARRAEPSADPAAMTLVSSGRPVPRHEVRVIEAEGGAARTLPERHEGRILFRGPSTMEGYFGRPEATAAVRRGDWIDTGDLGYLADGELYVTGRMKDLVIKGGRKYHPQDIERAAQRVQGIRQGCVVAFDVPAPEGEAIVVLAETAQPPERHAELSQAVREAVTDEIGTPPDRVVLVPPRTVPKTSSGKLMRHESRARFLAGSLLRRGRPAWLELAAVAVPSLARRLLAVLRGAGHLLYAVYASLIGLVIVSLGSVAILATCRTERTCWRASHGLLLLWGKLTGLAPRVSGRELPAEGAVLVSNHASYLDAPVLIMASRRPIRFTSKREVFSWPGVGRIMQRMGHLPIDRDSAEERLASYRRVAASLEAGRLVHLFPEGTFQRVAGIRPLRLGAFYFAAETGLPVVPVALRGTRTALGDRSRLLRPARIEVEVLDPIYPPPEAGFREVTRLRDQAQRALARAVREPLLETAGNSTATDS